MTFARAALVGTGYLGGSLVGALERAGAVGRVAGYDLSHAIAERARARGLVDEIAGSAAEAAAGADLVVLAVPVAAVGAAARAVAGALDAHALVIDLASVKAPVVAAVEAALPDGARYVGCHPIAGREHHGPDAADPELFQGRPCVLTPSARTRPDALAAAEALWRAAGAHVLEMAPERHDRLAARASHLPHVAAFALACALDDGEDTAALAGGSLRDGTRVAASPPPVWRDILLANAAELLPLLATFKDEIARIERAIADGDGAALAAAIARANRSRAQLVPG